MPVRIDIESIKQELSLADEARQAGIEGRARVCARRAAGWAVVIYRRRLGEALDDENALRNLAWLESRHDDELLRTAAGRLMTRVSADHRLPHFEDPLDDARLIIAELLEHN